MSNSIMTTNACGRIAFLALFSFVTAVRGGSVVSPFQQPSFADTETSVNFAVPAFEGCNVFRVQLQFDATPSNSVQIALGQDVDGDGRLSLRESGMALGWSGGEWFIRRKGDREWERYVQPGTTGAKSLELQRRLQPSAADQSITLKRDGVDLFFDNGTEGWLNLADLEGGLVRITTRGTDVVGKAVVDTMRDAKVMAIR